MSVDSLNLGCCWSSRVRNNLTSLGGRIHGRGAEYM